MKLLALKTILSICKSKHKYLGEISIVAVEYFSVH